MLEFLRIVIYYPVLNLLIFLIWLVPGHSAAWGIILLTLLIRIILLLPSKRAAQAQRKLAQMQPLVEELKTEYGEDKQGFAVAQMELYKKNNINPFASCGLLLVQLPLLYVLYYAVRDGLTLGNPHIYSWVAQPETINTFLFSINLLHPDPTRILAILAGVLQFVQMKMVMPPPPKNPSNPADPSVMMQRNMMYIFHLVTFFISFTVPAGVALYWVITTSFSIVQQYFVNKERLRLTGIDKALKTVEKLHPDQVEAYHASEKQVVEESTKKGVSITVRKKAK